MTDHSNINFVELVLEAPTEDELWWLACMTVDTLHFDAGVPLEVLREDARVMWQRYSSPWVYGKGIDRTGVSSFFVATQIFLYMEVLGYIRVTYPKISIMSAFKWSTIKGRLGVQSDFDVNCSDQTIKLAAQQIVTECLADKSMSLNQLLHQCGLMMGEVEGMIWTHPPAAVKAYEKFLAAAIMTMMEMQREENKLQATVKEYDIIHPAEDIKAMEDDWCVVTADDLEEVSPEDNTWRDEMI
ncbi:hypothetical protein QBC40DRAFT_300366 [Triangularia verruculosa]|uniref:Uncharacterized protein n=1 Tax=Triangularia verruculosa TaxID=2587418 RepID=A0AAN6XB47_9PEZI|nr:hypothetical protein QBC40DRAFT_300366 [Triangularia verruculosa]